MSNSIWFMDFLLIYIGVLIGIGSFFLLNIGIEFISNLGVKNENI